MQCKNKEPTRLSWRCMPGFKQNALRSTITTDDSEGLSGSGSCSKCIRNVYLQKANLHKASSIILDKPCSTNNSLNTSSETNREFAKLLENPGAWIKAHPWDSVQPKTPIPPELDVCLLGLSGTCMKNLISGMISHGRTSRRDLHRVKKGNKKIRGRSHRGLLAVEEVVVGSYDPEFSAQQLGGPVICGICLENQIKQSTGGGHVFCKKCLFKPL